MDLSNESKYILSILYKDYLEQTDNGISKLEARKPKDTDLIYDNLFSDMLHDDFIDSCYELNEIKFLEIIPGSDGPWRINLSHKAIIEMENEFTNNLNKLMDFILSIKNLIG